MHSAVGEIEEYLKDYEGIINSYVQVIEQSIDKRANVHHTILIRVWINEYFEGSEVMRKLTMGYTLKEQLSKFCDKFTKLQYEIYKV